MPRLDNSAMKTGEDDDVPPLDVCRRHYEFLHTSEDVPHPSYDDMPYYCAMCGARLTSDDD